METPADVQTWRRTVRDELLERRRNVPEAEQHRVSALVGSRIRTEFPELDREIIGFYWPIRGEIDLRPLVTELSGAGSRAALPVITGRNEPLAFAEWTPEARMVRGTWNIPVPSESEWIQPTVLLIPVLGFDQAGYRLGYGGGYYDRTLALMKPGPVTIGVGYESGRLESIFPQAHDLPLDAVVTESSFVRAPTPGRR